MISRMLAAAAPAARKRLVIVVMLAVVAGVAILVWRTFGRSSNAEGVIPLSGRLEGDDSAVAAKVAGRIVEIRVAEGDPIKAGDVIAILDDEQVKAREDQARAALTQSEARARAAREQIEVLEEQLRQMQLQTTQSRADAEGRVLEAEADLAGAEAQLAREQAAYQIAAYDRDAYSKLAQSGAVSERQGRQAASAAEQQAAAVTAARRRVDAARGALATAKANLTTPDIRAAQTAAIRGQIAQQTAEVASAAAQIDQVRAQLAEAQANRADLIVRAPFDGTVVIRTAQPGEIAAQGTPIVTLIDLSRVYLRGFVPEGQIGAVKIGQPARVYLDSNPEQPLEAYVSRVDPEAAFTPENTYFRDDRVKQVVGVKLQLKAGVKAGGGYAKPGMPADGEILVSGAWPGRRRS
jgi:HlyD family secretion protein